MLHGPLSNSARYAGDFVPSNGRSTYVTSGFFVPHSHGTKKTSSPRREDKRSTPAPSFFGIAAGSLILWFPYAGPQNRKQLLFFHAPQCLPRRRANGCRRPFLA